MGRRFMYEGEEWEVERQGHSHGVGPTRTDHWAVCFHRVADPDKTRIDGFIHQPDVNSVPEDQLRDALKEALEGNRSA